MKLYSVLLRANLHLVFLRLKSSFSIYKKVWKDNLYILYLVLIGIGLLVTGYFTLGLVAITYSLAYIDGLATAKIIERK